MSDLHTRARDLLERTEGHTPGPWEYGTEGVYDDNYNVIGKRIERFETDEIYCPLARVGPYLLQGEKDGVRVDEDPDARLVHHAPDLRALASDLLDELTNAREGERKLRNRIAKHRQMVETIHATTAYPECGVLEGIERLRGDRDRLQRRVADLEHGATFHREKVGGLQAEVKRLTALVKAHEAVADRLESLADGDDALAASARHCIRQIRAVGGSDV